MKMIEAVVGRNHTITLEPEMMKHMQLREGDKVTIAYDPTRIADKCFTLEENNEEEMFNGSFYCIPLRVFESAGLLDKDIQVLLGKGEITITTTPNVIGIIPAEFVGALIDQGVDLNELADNVVERINEDVLETEEECI